jgi:release factor glutamine methyltransferase
VDDHSKGSSSGINQGISSLSPLLSLGVDSISNGCFLESAPADPYFVGVTVLDVIQRSTEFLGKKGVDSPRLQTELLLAHLLDLPRMQLYLNFERALTGAQLDSFRELIKRRGQREPLQQITGSTSFCGLEIAVNRAVLVPRPETELLAEYGWRFLHQAFSDTSQPATAMDYGTGSGCLAIALAVHCPALRVSAVDLSAEALKVARQNAVRHGVAERIGFFQGDGFAALTEENPFDLIASNPPYIPTPELSALQPEVRDYEPREALDGGPDGLDYYRRLAAGAGDFLKPEGRIFLEFGDGQEQRLRTLFEQQNWIVEQIAEDYTHRPRILSARKSSAGKS